MASEAEPLSSLDMALKELGMLSSVTDSRQDYVREKRAQLQQPGEGRSRMWSVKPRVRNNHRGWLGSQSSGSTESDPSSSLDGSSRSDCCNVLQMNTRYVTGVVVGSQERRCQLCPLRFGWPSLRRPRHYYQPYCSRVRTRSENHDDEESAEQDTAVPSVSNPDSPEKFCPGTLFRSKSLEDVRLQNKDCSSPSDSGLPSHEVENVSQQIQRLHVH